MSDVTSPSAERDLTIDELAARGGMTVRNVRAYASRGLLPPPRLVGRTGYYGRDHVDRLLLLQPSVVRAGAQAIALGLDPDSVIDLLPVLSEHLSAIAGAFVSRVRDQIWHPFAEAGLPEDEWARVLLAVETLVPVAGQAVVTVFQRELGTAIREALGEELGRLTQSGG